jgi:hypothetical protein
MHVVKHAQSVSLLNLFGSNDRTMNHQKLVESVDIKCREWHTIIWLNC